MSRPPRRLAIPHTHGRPPEEQSKPRALAHLQRGLQESNELLASWRTSHLPAPAPVTQPLNSLRRCAKLLTVSSGSCRPEETSLAACRSASASPAMSLRGVETHVTPSSTATQRSACHLQLLKDLPTLGDQAFIQKAQRQSSSTRPSLFQSCGVCRPVFLDVKAQILCAEEQSIQ